MTTHRSDETFLADGAAQEWSNILIRTSAVAPHDIDDLLACHALAPDAKRGAVVFPDPAMLPSLKTVEDETRPVIGVILDDAITRTAAHDVTAMAARYAALAVEKDCEVVIFSHQNNAGFERFGFRVERIAGETEDQRAACVAQLRRFWHVEVLI